MQASAPVHRSIFLVGLPGAGKTYWGRLWAEAYGWSFADLDTFIEYREQRTIGELFAAGEASFRELERAALRELVQLYPAQTVIACGGGTPAFYDNLYVMKNAGCVVYLETGTAQALSNLQKDVVVRPLMQTEDPAAKLELLLQHRRIFYEQAHLIFSSGQLTAATFAEILHACTNRH